MTPPSIARRRLRNQNLIGPKPAGPGWALGLRCRGVVDADVEAAFNRGAIIRTHVLRPTWHFVDPADLR